MSIPNMVNNNYPSLDDALQILKESQMVTGMAFHRYFAVEHRCDMYNLEFKGKNIGFTEDFKNFSLHPAFEYLREIVEYNDIPLAA